MGARRGYKGAYPHRLGTADCHSRSCSCRGSCDDSCKDRRQSIDNRRTGLKLQQTNRAQITTDEQGSNYNRRTGLKLQQTNRAQITTDEQGSNYNRRTGLKLQQTNRAQKSNYNRRIWLKLQRTNTAQNTTNTIQINTDESGPNHQGLKDHRHTQFKSTWRYAAQ